MAPRRYSFPPIDLRLRFYYHPYFGFYYGPYYGPYYPYPGPYVHAVRYSAGAVRLRVRAERVAHRLEPQRLTWYEEPVPPERVEETLEINRRIAQPMAGGEILYGVSGFTPLIRTRAVDVIMPDVKHCGGLLELVRIAAVAESNGVTVAPHNPSGPVSTAASVQVCAVLKNFNLLEYQWGEASWRGELLNPPERFENGAIRVPDRPGLGVELNERTASAHRI